MSRPSFVLGADSALVLKYGSTDQAVIKGLNKLGLPSLARNVVSVTEYRRDFDIEFTTSGKFGQIAFGGNLVLGDSKGQDQLKQYLIKNAKFNDARLYLDYDTFLACDLANDPDSVMQVAEFSPPETDKNGVYAVSGKLVCGGQFAIFTKHLSGNTFAFVKGATASDNDTITDSANGFVTAGFEPGMVLIAEKGLAAPLAVSYHLIKTVAAGVLTLESLSAVTAVPVGQDYTFHGGRL